MNPIALANIILYYGTNASIFPNIISNFSSDNPFSKSNSTSIRVEVLASAFCFVAAYNTLASSLQLVMLDLL